MEIEKKCPNCGTSTREKTGKVAGGPVGGSGSVPYKRAACSGCGWVGAMVTEETKAPAKGKE